MAYIKNIQYCVGPQENDNVLYSPYLLVSFFNVECKCICLHAFVYELAPALKQLDLLFQGKPMELKLMFASIAYNEGTLTVSSEKSYLPFKYQQYEHVFKEWYAYLHKQLAYTGECSTRVVKYMKPSLKTFDWYFCKYISACSKTVSLCYGERKSKLRNMYLYIGTLNQDNNWNSYCYDVGVYDIDMLQKVLINIALLLQNKPTAIQLPTCALTYEDNAFTVTTTHSSITFIYIPDYHRQIIEWWFTGLCKILLPQCSKFYLSCNRFEQKILDVVTKDPTIDTLIKYC